MGSCLEYGNISEPVYENTFPVNPSSFGLIKNKIRSEIIQLDLNVRWYRLFYVFGSYQHKNSLLSLAYNSIINGQLPALKTPQDFHDFTPASTACKAIAEISKQDPISRIYNVGTGHLTSVAALCNELASQMKSSLRFEEPESPSGLCAHSLESKPNGICEPSIADEIAKYLKNLKANL
jgi:nucleoside-diphosphate-sugar epimerase